jgi:hypothetical protein
LLAKLSCSFSTNLTLTLTVNIAEPMDGAMVISDRYQRNRFQFLILAVSVSLTQVHLPPQGLPVPAMGRPWAMPVVDWHPARPASHSQSEMHLS